MDAQIDPRTNDIARRAVHDLLKEQGPGAFGPHFEHPDTLTERVTPTPLSSLRAARVLALALQRHAVESALAARGAGEAWEDVAAAFGQQVGGQPDAAAAYLQVLGMGADGASRSRFRGGAVDLLVMPGSRARRRPRRRQPTSLRRPGPRSGVTVRPLGCRPGCPEGRRGTGPCRNSLTATDQHEPVRHRRHVSVIFGSPVWPGVAAIGLARAGSAVPSSLSSA